MQGALSVITYSLMQFLGWLLEQRVFLTDK